MTFEEQMLVILLCCIATLLTRFLPFIIFRNDENISPRVNYLGRALPAALFAMLVVYCLKDVEFTGGTYGIPELISILFIVVVHLKWKNMLLSLVSGVAFYMIVLWMITIM